MDAEATKFPSALKFLFASVMPDGVTPIRHKVPYGGRGGAKSWGCARALLMLGAVQHKRVLCAREYQKSIADSSYRLLADQISKLNMNYMYDMQQHSIKGLIPLPDHTGALKTNEFLFEGLHSNLEKVKSYEGLTDAWVMEAQKTLKSSWNILTPTIRAPGSQIWAEFNPELETDETYQRYVIAPPPDAWVQKVSWRDNPWFPDVLRREMELMKEKDPDEYLWVWEGHCKQILAGAVYAEELRAARASGRMMAAIAYDPNKPVDVVFDLGWGDETVMWLGQAVAFEYRLLDYYHNRQKPFAHYLEWLQARRTRQGQPYVYGILWLPHDAKAKSLGTGKSIYEIACSMWGADRVRLVPKFKLEDGINAARTIFPSCYFDSERCADGIQALSHYRYEIVEGPEQQLSRKPVHDWSSHGADGFRYFATAVRQPRGRNRALERREAMEEKILREGITQHGRPTRGSMLGWMRR